MESTFIYTVAADKIEIELYFIQSEARKRLLRTFKLSQLIAELLREMLEAT